MKKAPSSQLNPYNVEVSLGLTSIRESIGLTKTELATLLGASKQAYDHWETGRAMFPPHKAKILVQQYGISLDILYARNERVFHNKT